MVVGGGENGNIMCLCIQRTETALSFISLSFSVLQRIGRVLKFPWAEWGEELARECSQACLQVAITRSRRKCEGKYPRNHRETWLEFQQILKAKEEGRSRVRYTECQGHCSLGEHASLMPPEEMGQRLSS